MKNELRIQALEVIESIAEGGHKPLTGKQADAIYRFAHCALCRCSNPHSDWVMELKREYKVLKDAGII